MIGLGNIGSKVANDAQRLGMKVIGYDPYLSIEHAWNLSHHVKRVNDLSEILRKQIILRFTRQRLMKQRECLIGKIYQNVKME